MNDPIDLRPMIREYISKISDVHQELRQRIDSSFTAWAAHVADAIQGYSLGDSQREVALYAVKEDEGGEILERHYLDREPAKRRAEIVGRYSHLESLSRQIITSASE